jgi:streptomycin 6-kinase
MSLTQYLASWNLTNPQPLAETGTSTVYTVQHNGETVVLKLIKPHGIEERAGAVVLGCYSGQGAVRLIASDDNAHLLEYADGEDLVPMVKRGDDEQATVIIAEVLNNLHKAYQGDPPDGLHGLERWFQSLFYKAEQDNNAGIESIFRRGAIVARKLLDNPQEECVLHGDMHHENVRYKEGRGWLAFDPKGVCGERTYDAANTLHNPMNMPDLVHNEDRLLRNAEILSERLEIDLSRILAYAFAYSCLSASWSLEDGEDDVFPLMVAPILERHVQI